MKTKKKLKVIKNKEITHTSNVNNIIDNSLEDFFWKSFNDVRIALMKEVDNLNNCKI